MISISMRVIHLHALLITVEQGKLTFWSTSHCGSYIFKSTSHSDFLPAKIYIFPAQITPTKKDEHVL
jgi:hypothetical protein